jgi:hypothetical protein
VIDDRTPIDKRDFDRRIGDDTPPLMNKVPEAPPSHWGKVTSRGRTASAAYLRFVFAAKYKEVRDGRAGS